MKRKQKNSIKKIIIILIIILIASLFILNKNKSILKNIAKEKESAVIDKFTEQRNNMVENQLKNRNINDKKVWTLPLPGTMEGIGEIQV